jgi:hypothetical protein
LGLTSHLVDEQLRGRLRRVGAAGPRADLRARAARAPATEVP